MRSLLLVAATVIGLTGSGCSSCKKSEPAPAPAATANPTPGGGPTANNAAPAATGELKPKAADPEAAPKPAAPINLAKRAPNPDGGGPGPNAHPPDGGGGDSETAIKDPYKDQCKNILEAANAGSFDGIEKLLLTSTLSDINGLTNDIETCLAVAANDADRCDRLVRPTTDEKAGATAKADCRRMTKLFSALKNGKRAAADQLIVELDSLFSDAPNRAAVDAIFAANASSCPNHDVLGPACRAAIAGDTSKCGSSNECRAVAEAANLFLLHSTEEIAKSKNPSMSLYAKAVLEGAPVCRKALLPQLPALCAKAEAAEKAKKK